MAASEITIFVFRENRRAVEVGKDGGVHFIDTAGLRDVGQREPTEGVYTFRARRTAQARRSRQQIAAQALRLLAALLEVDDGE